MLYGRSLGIDSSSADGDMDVFDAEPPPPPINLAYLIERTAFTISELKAMYRQFKQSAPNGWLTVPDLADSLARVFPRSGDILHLSE